MAWRLASATEGVLVVGEADGVLVLGEADAVQRRTIWTVPTGGGDDSAKEVSSIRDGGRRRWRIYMNCLPEQHSLVPQTRILAGFQPRRRGKTGSGLRACVRRHKVRRLSSNLKIFK